MKVLAKTIHAGDRIIVDDEGKKTSWHVSEIYIDRQEVRIRADRAVGTTKSMRGVREHRQMKFGPMHRVEVIRST